MRDNIGDGGATTPALVLIALITAAGFAVPGGGWLAAIVALAAAWVFVPTPVRRFGVIPVGVVATLGGLLGGWLAAKAGHDPGQWAAPLAAASVTALHLATNKGARVLVLLLIPFRSTFAEIRSPIFAALWAGAAVILVVIN